MVGCSVREGRLQEGIIDLADTGLKVCCLYSFQGALAPFLPSILPDPHHMQPFPKEGWRTPLGETTEGS